MQAWKTALTAAAALAAAAPALGAPPQITRPSPVPPAPRATPVPPPGALQPAPLKSLTVPSGTPLRCRGGPVKAMGLQLVPAGYGVFSAHFARGTKPADQGLEPGQCAWLDRAMTPEESSVVCQELNDLTLSLGHIASAAFTPNDVWLLDILRSNSISWIEKLRSPDQYFDFRVKSEGCQRVVT